MFYTTRDSEQQTFIHFTKSAVQVVTFQPWVAGNVPAEKKNETVDFFWREESPTAHRCWCCFQTIMCGIPLNFHNVPPWKHKNGKSSFSNWGYIFNCLFLLLLLLLLLSLLLLLWWWWLFASLTSLPPTLEKIFRDIGTEVKRRRHGWISGCRFLWCFGCQGDVADLATLTQTSLVWCRMDVADIGCTMNLAMVRLTIDEVEHEQIHTRQNWSAKMCRGRL